MNRLGSQMLHTKFHENDAVVLEKKIFDGFKGFFNIYWLCANLGHATSIMSLDFNFLVPKHNIQILVQHGLDLQSSHNFIP